MTRAYNIAFEVLAWIAGSVAVWAAMGAVLSFANWGNAFAQDGAMAALRGFIMMGFIISILKIAIMLKYNNI